MRRPVISREQVDTLFESKFVKVYDLKYREGKHYYDASRRDKEHLTAIKPDEEFQNMLADAVTLCVILRLPEGDFLLTFYEYRYPTGHFLLSPPAGLIDEADRKLPLEEAVYQTAVRELYEETGLTFKDTDIFRILNPLVFSSPGFTDECNAIALLILQNPDVSVLTDAHTEGSELFDGFCLLSEEKARAFMESGKDDRGNYYSIYTWQELLYFTAGFWKKWVTQDKDRQEDHLS